MDTSAIPAFRTDTLSQTAKHSDPSKKAHCSLLSCSLHPHPHDRSAPLGAMSKMYLIGAIMASWCSVAVHVSFNDPSAKANSNSGCKTGEAKQTKASEVESRPRDRVAEHHHRRFAFFTILGWVKFINFKMTPISAIAQAAYLFKLYFDSHLPSQARTAAAGTLMPSNRLVLINMLFYLLIILGGALRYWCYKTLDSYFTFRLGVKSDQKLIKHGPYTYLAHPSYFGALLCNLGVMGSLAGPANILLSLLSSETPSSAHPAFLQSWSPHSLVECLLTLQVLAHAWSAYRLMLLRLPDEEQMLRKHFGKEYDDYLAKRWRMLPFVW